MLHFGKAFFSSATPARVTWLKERSRFPSLVSPLICISEILFIREVDLHYLALWVLKEYGS